MSPTLLPNRLTTSERASVFCFLLLASVLTTRADPTPEAYAALQSNAPEALTLEITSVTKTAQANGVQVDAQATVLKVARTATNLKAGDAVAISYVQAPLPAGVVDSGQVPVVIKGYAYTAYLAGGPPPSAYGMAALEQSFIMQKDWPTPANPMPKGWADGQLANVRISQNGAQYFAVYGKPEASWPLLAVDSPPVLLHFYQSSADTPNVKVLVYRAGTMASPDPAGPLTIERAVIVTNPGNQMVGDALWAVDTTPGTASPKQPVWHWTADSLTVKNPFQMTIQDISLRPKAVTK
jgi:hypothetical protein